MSIRPSQTSEKNYYSVAAVPWTKWNGGKVEILGCYTNKASARAVVKFLEAHMKKSKYDLTIEGFRGEVFQEEGYWQLKEISPTGGITIISKDVNKAEKERLKDCLDIFEATSKDLNTKMVDLATGILSDCAED